MRMPSRSRLVADVGDALDALVADQLGDLLDQRALLTWYGISVVTIDLRPVFGCSSMFGARAHEHRAAAGLVGGADAAARRR